MQEYTSPGAVEVDPTHSVATALFEHARLNPQRLAVSHRVGDQFVDWTTRQFVDEVVAVAKGIIGLGIEPGSSICLMSATRLEWTLLDYAIWAAGCVTVPIYETSSAEQVEWIASDSGAVALVVATADLRARYEEVADRVPDVQHVFTIDDNGINLLKAAGAEVDDAAVEERRTAVGADDLATIVYTSGTTGRPKGCELTHRNFLFDVAQVLETTQTFFHAGQSTLLFLPLAHIFARVIQVGCITAGVRIGYSTGTQHLLEELAMLQPNFVLAVPRVFEKVFNGAQQRAQGDGKGAIFDRATETAISYSEELDAGGVSLKTRVFHFVFERLVYRKLRGAMGGQVEYAVSGGAALGPRLGHFFRGIGVTILEGYGLTETTAASTVNRPDHLQIGSVGKPIPGVTIRIADDGEILIKGDHIFRGYRGNPEATREALEHDGWFHTGDIGQLDTDGFLRITGRKKELIVTAGGKNVAPAVLEDRMRSHFLVSQAMVVGDGEPFIAAVVTIDADAFPAWAAQQGREGATVAAMIDDEALLAQVQEAVDHANAAVSKAESIRTFRILPEDFEVGVELSQKQSVKRHVVGEKYKHVIDDIYATVQRM